MYAFLAIVLVTVIALVLVAFPCHLESYYMRVWHRRPSEVLCAANHASFCSHSEAASRPFRYARICFFASAVLFAFFGLHDGSAIRNHPESINKIARYGAAAFCTSAFVVFSVLAYGRLLPSVKEHGVLSRCGFRNLWVLDRPNLPKDLADDLRRKAQSSRRIGVLDVTGYELFVRSTADRPGILTEVLRDCPNVPVSVLLMNPLSQSPDPDSDQVNAFQSLLTELGIRGTVFVKRLRDTIDTIKDINQGRSPRAQISVRFYDEKPSMQAVVFDESMLVFPWGSRTLSADLPCMEFARQSAVPSLYETFRRDFARLWKGSTNKIDPPLKAAA